MVNPLHLDPFTGYDIEKSKAMLCNNALAYAMARLEASN